MSKFRFLGFILTVSLLAISIFTTCDSPLGMGLPIDWEAPVLTLDPVSNPLYVRNGTVLTGKVTDNVGVDRIIFIDTATGKELFPVQRSGDNFRIDLIFSEEQNGETILAQVVAYDKMGNSGATSIATVVLYIDIRPPIVKSIDIKRTDTRTSDLAPYTELKELEDLPLKDGGDPDGEKKDFIYKYQNGWFYVNSTATDDETKIEIISLDLYDANFKGSNNSVDVNTLVISLPIDQGYSNYFPRWTVKEEEIINAGQDIFKGNYKSNYYNNKTRYYYRVVVKAIDKSGNENQPVQEDQGYICLWAKSDEPKGIIDPGIGAIVSRGTPLPVDIYDDDSLLWAYVGLLTLDQWNGIKPIFGPDSPPSPLPSPLPSTYITIPSGTNEEKLLFLKNRLTGTSGNAIDSVTIGSGSTVYNWKYDKYMYYPTSSQRLDPITEQINGKNIDETVVSIITGNEDTDYGDYILFTIAADKKLTPHTGAGPEWTNKNIWSAKAKPVQITDENAPLIVFDTSAGCPEENTFPQTLLSISGSEEKYFKIVGYTLRENASGLNGVRTFRMAWIPKNMPDGPDKYISDVQNALNDENYGTANAKFNSPALNGIQHWDFAPSPEKGTPAYNSLTDEQKKHLLLDIGNESIDINTYRRQSFSKTFSVMGDADDLKPETNNFIYNEELENESKLFVFYAKDNMGHEVFRQLRILGFKEKPELFVYDITNRLLTVPNGIPNPTLQGNVDPATGSPTTPYYTALNNYNKLGTVISALKGAATTSPLASRDEAIPFQIYPRGTIVKYWVTAVKGGRIGIDTVTMKDVTFAKDATEHVLIGSGYVNDAYSFCEYYPDVTQRTFLFEAKDKLGNVKQIQRTIAVTNAARLESITTTKQNGTYGMGQKITLTANFSSQIFVNLDGSNRPVLNIRYKKAGDTNYTYEKIPCNTPVPTKTSPSISLDFDFTVPENAKSILETMYGDPSIDPDYNLPLELSGDTKIMDYNREDEAFIPGYATKTVTMPNWINDANTLQAKKEITLDGVRPVITGATWGGKAAYSGDGKYYFKEGESITLTVSTASGTGKDIKISDNPLIQYSILDTNSTLRGPYRAEFKYQKPGTTKKELIFSLLVNSTSCPYNGRITNVSLYTTNGNIVDDVGNTASGTAVITAPSVAYYVKTSKPSIPVATLNGTLLASASDTYNQKPTLVIPDSTSSYTPDSVPWEDTKQYSLNGGLLWQNYTTGVEIPIGTHKLQTRYIDRAGNEGTPNAEKTIQVNDAFPKLVSVSATQSNGWYIAGKNLEFNLNFADKVRVQTAANVTIKIANRATGTPVDDSTSAKTITTSTAASTNTYTTTIKFAWNNISGKEMKDGLYIYAVDLSGLRDEFGNSGNAGTGVWNGNITMTSTPNYTCPNLPWTSATACIKVDTIPPEVLGRNPDPIVTPSGNNLIKEIKITFKENVMKGKGIITIRPKGTYAIPPVFEDKGYYLGYTSNGQTTGTEGEDQPVQTKFTSSGENRTYVSSLYDIYNSIPSAPSGTTLTQTQLRGYLVEGTSLSSLANKTINRSGLNKGPYIKMTQGLVPGYGHTGNYTNTPATTSGANAPSPSSGFLIPDTATKWVLDYQYGINQDIDAVKNIRTALTHAKWRWQEIDIVNATGDGTATITIKLNEPLLKGLEWEVYYPEGTFTDLAGNPAPASGVTATNPTAWTNSDYYFTSPGVQTPVIRVNRRSSDSRADTWATKITYDSISDTPNWDSIDTVKTDSDGWGKGNFNYVHFRVESESPKAEVKAQSYKGTGANRDMVKGDWSGSIRTVNYNPGTGFTDKNWDVAASDTVGEWLLPNLIQRSRTTASQTTFVGRYTVTTKNSTAEQRQSAGVAFRMFKSYNKDITAGELGYPSTSPTVTLDDVDLSENAATKGQGYLDFTAYEASKSYIVGSAKQNGVTAKGLEGVFRTVIMFNFSGARRNSFIAVEGSNVKNGIPSVAGFPVRDADENDCRYIKAFYDVSATATDYNRFYWVSTEIVCEWYFLSWGGNKQQANALNGSHQNNGEVNNYLMVGYGDLTYGYNITRDWENN